MERLSEPEWKQLALAWLAFELQGRESMSVSASFHIDQLGAGKKADVRRQDEVGPTFEIAFGRRPPKELELTMTDTAKTQVDCNLAGALKFESGLLGVFQHDGVLLCHSRDSG